MTAGEGKQLDLSAADSHKEGKTKEELRVKALIGDVHVCTTKHTDLNTQGGWRDGSLEPSR